jgi:AcrR family transcriptional regulator
MAGRKQFDEETALDAAMRTFWRKGFEATSVQDLEAATGLGKSSIYNAYQGKAALYALCLERFSRRYTADLLKSLNEMVFADAIESLFEGLLDRFQDPQVPDGCLATMAALEAGISGPEAAAQVAAGLTAMQASVKARAEQAVRYGDLPIDTDCDALGAFVLAQARGMAVLNRGTGNSDLARQAAHGAVALLRNLTPKS